jgi:hypothetical protein
MSYDILELLSIKREKETQTQSFVFECCCVVGTARLEVWGEKKKKN